MKVKDIIKKDSWILNKINGEAEFVIAEGRTEKVLTLNNMIIRNTHKAVLLATTDGELWLPLSVINFTHTGGQQYYDAETGRRTYERNWIYNNNDEAIFLLSL